LPTPESEPRDTLAAVAIVHPNDAVAEGPLASVAVTVTFERPTSSGAPEISPLAGAIVSPRGNPVAA
jgi:hypothetical protein